MAEQDSFVTVLVPSPADAPPGVRLLRGYVGESTDAARIRLYLSAELDSWVELPKAAVKHRRRDPSDPLGAEYVWIDRNASTTAAPPPAQNGPANQEKS